jgi:hypothetical protein
VKKNLGLKVQEDNKEEIKETKEDVVVEKETLSEK